MAWRDLPIGAQLFQNLDEQAITRSTAALENAFVTEAAGLSGFPGLVEFSRLGDNGQVYLHDWRDQDDDLIAVTSEGRVYRVDQDGDAQDVTGVPVSGGRRVVFAKTDDELLMAAGGKIIGYAGDRTFVLSEDAPESTHVGYVDGYTLAIEARSQRFYHTAPGQSRSWDPLDVFTAEGKADDLNALLVTEFRELLLAGEDSVEQFDRLPNGERPFFRRWASGQGVFAPYTLVNVDAGAWAVNRAREFYRLSAQTARPVSDPIGRILVGIEDWEGAWAASCLVGGQKFIVLQIPRAASQYGEGMTFGLDYRSGRWFTLYGWDATRGLPTRWPGWSIHQLNGRTFVGGQGRIYELRVDAHDNAGSPRRVVWRSANYDASAFSKRGADEVRVNNIRARVKIGVGSSNAARDPVMSLRVKRDNGAWSRWVDKSIGRTGDDGTFLEFGNFGQGYSFQVEVHARDAVQFELVKLQADVDLI